MSNKQNSPFNAPKQQVKTDPVKEAQVQAQAERVVGTTPPADVVQQVEKVNDMVAEAAAEKATESNVVETAAEVVKDTTKPVSQELVKSSILKPAPEAKQPNQVVRPSGAAAREASPAPVNQGSGQVVSNEFSSVINRERKEGTVNAVTLISFLDNYVKVMAPRRITSVAEVLKQQEGMYDQLMTVITRAPAKEFNRLWNIAILYFREYKNGCFSPMYYSRGAREWKRDPNQFLTLTSLLNLLEASATDLASVNSVVNVNAVVGKGFSEDARGRVINFYMK